MLGGTTGSRIIGCTVFSLALFASIAIVQPAWAVVDPPISIHPTTDICTPLLGYSSCAAACEAEPMGCAEVINDHIQTSFDDDRLMLQPGLDGPVEVKKPNIQTPMHSLFVDIYVNDLANAAIEDAFDNPFETPELPPYSIVAKFNVNPGNDTWATHMYKIPGYCPTRVFGAAGGACLGGEWFYLLYRGGLLSFDWDPTYGSEAAYGKAEAFCIDCHGAVQDADWLWLTHDVLDRLRQVAKPLSRDGERPGRGGAGQCDDVESLSHRLVEDVGMDPNDVPLPGSAQRMFDCFSWLSFVAVNWPASGKSRGVPDTESPFSRADRNRVWETYKQVYETFQPDDPDWTLDGQSFRDRQPLPQVCEDLQTEQPRRRNGGPRAFELLNETHQAYGNQFNTIVDQNHNELLFNIRFNQTEWEFVRKFGYADTGNYDFNGPLGARHVVFPDNRVRDFNGGAIEIKSAWKELCTDSSCNPQDDPDRYYARTAFVYTAAVTKSLGTVPESCRIAEVGLVGLHLVRKTFWAPQWVWATFEHVDNVPDVGEEVDTEALKNPYSLFDPQCLVNPPSAAFCLTQRPVVFGVTRPGESGTIDTCCSNLQSLQNSHPHPANSAPLEFIEPEGLIPTQVTRIDDIGESAKELNTIFQGLLRDANSPFQYYELISSQWAKDGRLGRNAFKPYAVVNQLCLDDDAFPCFTVEPRDVPDGHGGMRGRRLRNTTMETFQVAFCSPDDEDISNDPVDCISGDLPTEPIQASTAGCLNCHYSAGTDSSFIWADALEERVPLN